MRSYRSPLRLFIIGLIGIVLLIAATDVMFGHWLSTPPDNNDGVLTTRGQAQQRGDIVWGAAMVGVGTLLVGGAVVELVRRRPQVVVGSNEVTLAIGSAERDVAIEWANVRAVASDVATDPYDGALREQLVIDVYDRTGLPDDPLGAQWSGNELRVDAHDWTRDVGDIALACQGALGHHRRVEEIKEMGPPSMVWESVVDGEDASAVGVIAGVVTDTDTAPVGPVSADPAVGDPATGDPATEDRVTADLVTGGPGAEETRDGEADGAVSSISDEAAGDPQPTTGSVTGDDTIDEEAGEDGAVPDDDSAEEAT